jgi:RimJ/RimL family protein N-acetyltransferase
MNATTSSNNAFFSGKLVRLAAPNPEKEVDSWARWNQDSEFQVLESSGPTMLWPARQIREFMEKLGDNAYPFSIYTLAENQFIGNITFDGIDWTARNCWVGIGIGERAFWGKGYGSEAMNLGLRFCFEALNLRRVTLDVFEYNQRAYRSYLKCGFKEEGRLRQWMLRGGQRYDLIFMGILREEWEQKNPIYEAVLTGPIQAEPT